MIDWLETPPETVRWSEVGLAGRRAVAAESDGRLVLLWFLSGTEDAEEAVRRETQAKRLERSASVRLVTESVGRGEPSRLGTWGSHRRFLEAIASIPPGETRTYGQVAAMAGSPAAARAAARAASGNRLAVVVPCHRVVPAAGGTGGYRWGSSLKSELLALEGVCLRNRR
jgi:O-6-methylguanine DNA methyltransferase